MQHDDIQREVLPIPDGRQYHVPGPTSGRYTYYPGTSEVPEHSAANTHNRSYKIRAEVELSNGEAEGVIVAQGSRFGGSLFIKDNRLHYVYNFLGIGEEQRFSSDELEPGARVFGVEFTKEGKGEHGEPTGTTKLYVDDDVVAEGPMRALTIQFALCDEGLCVGYDGGDAVSSEYKPKFEFGGGKISQVVFDLADDVYVDVERQLAAAMARD
jgi:hypothetical protein